MGSTAQMENIRAHLNKVKLEKKKKKCSCSPEAGDKHVPKQRSKKGQLSIKPHVNLTE